MVTFIESKLRRWGRSLGIVVPMKAVDAGRFREGDIVRLILSRKSNALRDTFGTLKIKGSTDDILKDADEESWDE